jgi:mono/diheme cytochrome c family protein
MTALALALVLLQAAPAPRTDTPRPPSPAAPKAADGKGRQVYEQACSVCHMMDGSGVPNLQPSLDRGNKVVQGRPETLIALVLKGPKGVLPARREPYANEMPAFDTLSDEEIAGLLTYLRSSLGNKAPAVSAKQVAAVRARR